MNISLALTFGFMEKYAVKIVIAKLYINCTLIVFFLTFL